MLTNDVNIYCDNIEINPFKEPNKSLEFIQQYFKLGKKSAVLNFEIIESYKRDGKHIHTVSMYFIGCLLYKMVESEITPQLVRLIPKWNDLFVENSGNVRG
ncbi:hypothetical protein PV797_10735 [Clostridiaceae bacterium M8S5]|nr:hypothetical protein PV797_10735 [Clostridiaceae bacterium M8S5]